MTWRFWRTASQAPKETPEHAAARQATEQLKRDLERALVLRAVAIERNLYQGLEPE